jgi:D-aminoacyl-tRNA deacylase
MILIVSSTKDIASVTISKFILQKYPFSQKEESYHGNPSYSAEIKGKKITFVTLNEETILAQDLPKYFIELELIIFVSRHKSVSGIPTLSVHTPGNFGSAELGGLPKTVSISPANPMKHALKALAVCRDIMKLNYEVSYECTHHGPSLNVPSMFVELGSSEKQWTDLRAAEAVAFAVMEAVVKFDQRERSVVIGIGGPHYNLQFTRMALRDEEVFGHMIPKHAINLLDAEMLQQCVDRTLEKVEYALLDWKGIRGEDKPNLMSLLNEIGLSYKKA